jgi:hypothetical protein
VLVMPLPVDPDPLDPAPGVDGSVLGMPSATMIRFITSIIIMMIPVGNSYSHIVLSAIYCLDPQLKDKGTDAPHARPTELTVGPPHFKTLVGAPSL